MKPHERLIEKWKAMVNETEHGAIIILSDRTGGVADIEYATNLQLENQLRILRKVVHRLERRGVA